MAGTSRLSGIWKQVIKQYVNSYEKSEIPHRKHVHSSCYYLRTMWNSFLKTAYSGGVWGLDLCLAGIWHCVYWCYSPRLHTVCTRGVSSHPSPQWACLFYYCPFDSPTQARPTSGRGAIATSYVEQGPRLYIAVAGSQVPATCTVEQASENIRVQWVQRN